MHDKTKCKVTIILSIILIIATGFLFYFNRYTNSVNQPNQSEANKYLDKILVSGVKNVPSSSCGIALPDDIPVQYLEIEATAWSKDLDEQVNLIQDTEFKPGQWIVFEDLQKYSQATCTMRINVDGTILAEKTVDLLNYSDEKD